MLQSTIRAQKGKLSTNGTILIDPILPSFIAMQYIHAAKSHFYTLSSNRTPYFNYISDKLGELAYQIEQKGKLNILDLHIHAEGFFIQFLKQLFDWNCDNLNQAQQNIEAIDLIDHGNQFIMQVSATCTKQKVESALSKDIMQKYPHYTFKFISISKDGAELRKKTFKNPHGIKFSANDIIDNITILSFLLGGPIDKQKLVAKFIEKELGGSIDFLKLETNLAIVINILSKEDFRSAAKPVINSYEIDRKIDHNNLVNTRIIIEEKKVFYNVVDRQYSLLDKLGSNKSLSVLSFINKSYVEEAQEIGGGTEDELFMNVIKNVTDKVLSSANYVEIPLDELDFCVTVLVVDSFIRCKIFKNPSNYQYAVA